MMLWKKALLQLLSNILLRTTGKNWNLHQRITLQSLIECLLEIAGYLKNCKVSVEVEKDGGYRTNEVSVRAGSTGRSLLEVKKTE